MGNYFLPFAAEYEVESSSFSKASLLKLRVVVVLPVSVRFIDASLLQIFLLMRTFQWYTLF